MGKNQRRMGGVFCAALIMCWAAWAGEAGNAASSSGSGTSPAAQAQPVSWLDQIQVPLFAEAGPKGERGASGTPAAAANPDEQAPVSQMPWEVKFKVYAWIPGMSGHAGVGRAVSHLDVDYCDVLENLDLVESMAPFNLEARYGRFGLFADLFYVKLADQVQRGPITANLEATQTILELGGFYRVGTWPVNPSGQSTISLDALSGARFNRLEGNLGLQTPRHEISIGGVQEWWDPFVGPRVTWQANDKFSVFARTDVGGFGIEHCSDFAWQFIAGAEYDITKNVFVELGYRLLDTSFHNGSGRKEFTYDVLMQGPYLALGVKF